MESGIIVVMEYFGSLVAIAQATVLLSGSLYLFPFLGEITTDPSCKSDFNQFGCDKYCDYDIVMFSLVFLSLCWVYMTFAALCFLYIKCCGEDVTQAMKAHLINEMRGMPSKFYDGKRAGNLQLDGKGTEKVQGMPKMKRHRPVRRGIKKDGSSQRFGPLGKFYDRKRAVNRQLEDKKGVRGKSKFERHRPVRGGRRKTPFGLHRPFRKLRRHRQHRKIER